MKELKDKYSTYLQKIYCRFLTNDKKIEINRKKTLIGNAEGNKEIPIKKQI